MVLEYFYFYTMYLRLRVLGNSCSRGIGYYEITFESIGRKEAIIFLYRSSWISMPYVLFYY